MTLAVLFLTFHTAERSWVEDVLKKMNTGREVSAQGTTLEVSNTKTTPSYCVQIRERQKELNICCQSTRLKF